jgi:hypothetical protein
MRSPEGTYALAPLVPGGLTFLTFFTQGQISLQGRFAQPGPGEFLIEISSAILLFNRQ